MRSRSLPVRFNFLQGDSVVGLPGQEHRFHARADKLVYCSQPATTLQTTNSVFQADKGTKTERDTQTLHRSDKRLLRRGEEEEEEEGEEGGGGGEEE